MSRLSAIGREICFAFAICDDRLSILKLIFHTFLYHAHNHRIITDWGNLAFTINVRLGRLGSRPLLLRTFRGDLFIFYENLMAREYYVPDIILEKSKVKIIVDAGANIGISSLFFAMNYDDAEIFAIEASAENFRILAENAAGIDRIKPIHAALIGQPAEVVYFSMGHKAWGNRVLDETGSGAVVPGMTMDRLSSDYCLDKIDLLKVDIEGGEADVFAHGGFLSRVRFGVIELHPPYEMGAFQRDVGAFGFDLILPTEASGLAVLAFRPSVVGADVAEAEQSILNVGEDSGVQRF